MTAAQTQIPEAITAGQVTQRRMVNRSKGNNGDYYLYRWYVGDRPASSRQVAVIETLVLDGAVEYEAFPRNYNDAVVVLHHAQP